MDQESPTVAANTQRGVEAEYGDYSSPHSRKPGRRQKKRKKQPKPIDLLFQTVDHFMPGLSSVMNRLDDPRKTEQCIYSQAHLLWSGILMFMMHLGSRCQMRFERDTAVFADNMAKLSGQGDVGYVADPDTLAYYAEKISVEEVEKILGFMIRHLIRMKALDGFRLYDYFTIAIDGTQICTFDKEPWPDCPHRKRSNGTIQYFAYVLDAKLVTHCGMALTLASEILTNEGHEVFDKQDCELKAFPRLVEKLHELFPRTPFCLLLDGLYANRNSIRIIENKRWKYIISFKEGSMPERFAEAKALIEMQNKNRLVIRKKDAKQTFVWANNLPVAEFTPDVIFCKEQPDSGDSTTFGWITNFHVCANNIDNIANKGGRLRWKVENEGFNVQKNNGYEMEHPYSEHVNGFRTFYLLLLIAHFITQLILHGSLIKSLRKTFGSAKNFAKRLAESLRIYLIPDDLVMPGQIRFSTVTQQQCNQPP